MPGGTPCPSPPEQWPMRARCLTQIWARTFLCVWRPSTSRGAGGASGPPWTSVSLWRSRSSSPRARAVRPSARSAFGTWGASRSPSSGALPRPTARCAARSCRARRAEAVSSCGRSEARLHQQFPLTGLPSPRPATSLLQAGVVSTSRLPIRPSRPASERTAEPYPASQRCAATATSTGFSPVLQSPCSASGCGVLCWCRRARWRSMWSGTPCSGATQRMQIDWMRSRSTSTACHLEA
mmetsp:Transcript_93664/g.297210  ORF Transcript_93664/g.297210 Transcript_93664/m.297210 type:complete len:238 (-) Transcript_93664:107-820(-)